MQGSGFRGTLHARSTNTDRIRWVEIVFIVSAVIIVARCFQLQVIEGRMYRLLATDQHELQKLLAPERGQILVRDRADGSLHPLATNRDAWTLYAVPREMDDLGLTAREIAPYTKETEAALVARWSADPDDPYDPLAKDLDAGVAKEIRAKGLKGIGLVKTSARLYPERDIGGQLIGFVRNGDDGIGVGTYGIEGSKDDLLRGSPGYVVAQKDAGGRRLMLNGGTIHESENGSDVILTIDRTIQYETCARLNRMVASADAEGGTVVVMDPKTGAIIAMCSAPDFNPAEYGQTKDVSVFNNPVTFSTYEPGSVFKAITMAIGVERGKVGPNTTYEDTGVVKIDRFEIKNSDLASHGTQTMTQVLEKSLNTGSIFVERQLGRDAFRAGVEAFGFGAKTGIELSPEAKGNISSLEKKSEVYGATASFGQGITVTPIQLAAAFSAIANGGKLMRPYVIDEIVHPDGSHEKTKPVIVRRPISSRTSDIIRGMLVSVVEHGHGGRASVPGYYVAGKTGTAQVANPNGPGYLENTTITTYAGFVPANDPKFVIITRLVKPKAGKWAELNAAPLFHDVASFALAYLGVPTEREIRATKEEAVPTLPNVTGAPDIVSVEGEGTATTSTGPVPEQATTTSP